MDSGMSTYDLYEDMKSRTNGEIYIGVVGPVRTGKSTFIKRFMNLMVLPNIEEEPLQIRARDELPMSASGKTVTTTEPKFIPQEAVPSVTLFPASILSPVLCNQNSGSQACCQSKDHNNLYRTTVTGLWTGHRSRCLRCHL